ncbi:hypothetical protein GOBAR_DD35387 [Gossypium barbadense]|nr:hypothetical protein GOBAR_DD35387 [Gossypium barbadense]
MDVIAIYKLLLTPLGLLSDVSVAGGGMVGNGDGRTHDDELSVWLSPWLSMVKLEQFPISVFSLFNDVWKLKGTCGSSNYDVCNSMVELFMFLEGVKGLRLGLSESRDNLGRFTGRFGVRRSHGQW